MGNIFSTFMGVSIDYLVGSLTGCLWEWVFNTYDPSKGTMISVFEGLLQLTASVTTAYWLHGIVTPVGVTSGLGMVAVMFFTLSYSPNLRAKLNAGHQLTKTTLAFDSTSFLSGPSEIKSN